MLHEVVGLSVCCSQPMGQLGYAARSAVKYPAKRATGKYTLEQQRIVACDGHTMP